MNAVFPEKLRASFYRQSVEGLRQIAEVAAGVRRDFPHHLQVRLVEWDQFFDIVEMDDAQLVRLPAANMTGWSGDQHGVDIRGSRAFHDAGQILTIVSELHAPDRLRRVPVAAIIDQERARDELHEPRSVHP